MAERRRSDRRTNNAVPEPIERKRERRQGDRRDSERRKTKFVVNDVEVEGEVGLGGASFTAAKAVSSSTLTIELKIGKSSLQLSGKVLEPGREVHLSFGELDTDTELKLAKWLDRVES